MRKVISKDGTPIAFDQSGHGPPIILVAGATATRLAEASLAGALATWAIAASGQPCRRERPPVS